MKPTCCPASRPRISFRRLTSQQPKTPWPHGWQWRSSPAATQPPCRLPVGSHQQAVCATSDPGKVVGCLLPTAFCLLAFLPQGLWLSQRTAWCAALARGQAPSVSDPSRGPRLTASAKLLGGSATLGGGSVALSRVFNCHSYYAIRCRGRQGFLLEGLFGGINQMRTGSAFPESR